jgi:hypothetical protein
MKLLRLPETVCWMSRTGYRWTALLLLLSIGCSSGGNPYPVNSQLAEETLNRTLDAWKDGKTPEEMQEETPPVVVQDMDWMNGKKLLEFEVLDDSQAVDANLIAKVKIKMSTGDGKMTERTVTYVVGTAPKLTVFRDLMH